MTSPSKPLNVFFVASGLDTGGAELMLYKILSRFDRKRVAPTVISVRPAGPVKEKFDAVGIPVRSLEVKSPLHAWAGLRRFRALLASERPDAVQGWMYHANLLTALALRGRNGPPLVWGVRYTLQDLSYDKPLTRALIRLSPRLAGVPVKILFDSKTGRNDHEKIGYPSAKLAVEANGIDFAEWKPDPAARTALRTELGLPTAAKLIGLIGRYHPIKDHATFAAAAARLAAERADVHFLFAGLGTEASNAAASALRSAHKLEGRLSLLGQRADAAGVIGALDVLSCASRSESFPNVVLEALGCGVLSVVSDIGDAPELVPDRRFVVPRSDAGALAAAWRTILEMPEAERAAIVSEARRQAAERYDINAVAERYQSLYESLVS